MAVVEESPQPLFGLRDRLRIGDPAIVEAERRRLVGERARQPRALVGRKTFRL